MKTITRTLLGSLLLLASLSAFAQVHLEAARVAAMNTEAVADFYKTVFGLQEVNRLNMGNNMVEIMLNFGESVDAAKANHNAQVVVMGRASDDVPADPVPHVIFNVADINAMADAIRAAGGKINEGHPVQFGNSGIYVAFCSDPAGNMFEMLQFPAASQ